MRTPRGRVATRRAFEYFGFKPRREGAVDDLFGEEE